jgi:hypothetical protein
VIPRPEQLETIARVTGGNLSEIPFAVLLHSMAVTGRSAVLELERKAVKKVVVLEKGVPVECRSNLLHETLGQVLVDRKAITEEERQRCLNQSVSGERHLGEILISHGLITASELYRVLQQTLAKKLLHIFTWRSGTFRVCPGLEQVESPFKIKTAQLVVTGVSRFALDEEVHATMDPLRKSKLFLSPDPPYRLVDIRLNPAEKAMVDGLREGKSMKELVADARIPSEKLGRLLYALVLIGVVVPEEWLARAKEKATKADGDSTMRLLATQPITVPTDAPPSKEDDDTMPIRRAAWARASGAEDSGDPESIGNEVMETYLRYRELDAFDLLEVEENASPGDIRDKYIEFSRKFAPWRFANKELHHLLDKVQDLFLAGGSAYGQLSDPARRSLLIAQRHRLRQEKRKEMEARAALRKEFLDSELQFKKGRALMRRGLHAEALRELELAHDCDPESSKYRAELAYCRYLSAPAEADKCLVELSETVRLDPDCGLAVYYTGLIEGELGHGEQADALIRKALKMMIPDRRSLEALKVIKSLREGHLKEKKGTPVA